MVAYAYAAQYSTEVKKLACDGRIVARHRTHMDAR